MQTSVQTDLLESYGLAASFRLKKYQAIIYAYLNAITFSLLVVPTLLALPLALFLSISIAIYISISFFNIYLSLNLSSFIYIYRID